MLISNIVFSFDPFASRSIASTEKLTKTERCRYDPQMRVQRRRNKGEWNDEDRHFPIIFRFADFHNIIQLDTHRRSIPAFDVNAVASVESFI